MYGAESFNRKEFFPTEAALIFVMIAYHLMAIFRLFVLQEKAQKTLSTLRYRTFAIGAYFEKVGDTLKRKIPLVKKREENDSQDYGITPLICPPKFLLRNLG